MAKSPQVNKPDEAMHDAASAVERAKAGMCDTRHQIDLSMSNFDHSIDSGLEAALRADPTAYAQYAAWNFCGYVCAEGDGFDCEIWVYGAPVKTIHADTLQQIMDTAFGEYGSR